MVFPIQISLRIINSGSCWFHDQRQQTFFQTQSSCSQIVLLIGITGIENRFFSDVILTYKFTIFSQNDQLNQLIDQITIHLNVMV